MKCLLLTKPNSLLLYSRRAELRRLELSWRGPLVVIPLQPYKWGEVLCFKERYLFCLLESLSLVFYHLSTYRSLYEHWFGFWVFLKKTKQTSLTNSLLLEHPDSAKYKQYSYQDLFFLNYNLAVHHLSSREHKFAVNSQTHRAAPLHFWEEACCVHFNSRRKMF